MYARIGELDVLIAHSLSSVTCLTCNESAYVPGSNACCAEYKQVRTCITCNQAYHVHLRGATDRGCKEEHDMVTVNAVLVTPWRRHAFSPFTVPRSMTRDSNKVAGTVMREVTIQTWLEHAPLHSLLATAPMCRDLSSNADKIRVAVNKGMVDANATLDACFTCPFPYLSTGLTVAAYLACNQSIATLMRAGTLKSEWTNDGTLIIGTCPNRVPQVPCPKTDIVVLTDSKDEEEEYTVPRKRTKVVAAMAPVASLDPKPKGGRKTSDKFVELDKWFDRYGLVRPPQQDKNPLVCPDDNRIVIVLVPHGYTGLETLKAMGPDVTKLMSPNLHRPKTAIQYEFIALHHKTAEAAQETVALWHEFVQAGKVGSENALAFVLDFLSKAQ